MTVRTTRRPHVRDMTVAGASRAPATVIPSRSRDQAHFGSLVLQAASGFGGSGFPHESW